MAKFIEGWRGKFIYAGDAYVAAAGFDIENWDVVMANARLIAASPTMFEYILKKSKEGDPHAKEIIAEITR